MRKRAKGTDLCNFHLNLPRPKLRPTVTRTSKAKQANQHGMTTRSQTARRHWQGFVDLPHEILSIIFEETCGTPLFDATVGCIRLRLRQAVRLSHICGHARAVAVNHRRLWNWVWVQMKQEALVACLERTGSIGLHLNLIFPIFQGPGRLSKFKTVVRFLQLAGQHVERWSSLFVAIEYASTLRKILNTGRSKTFTMLTHLDFNCAPYHWVDDTRPYSDFGRQNGIECLEWHMPALQLFHSTHILPSAHLSASSRKRPTDFKFTCMPARSIQIPLNIFTMFTEMDLTKARRVYVVDGDVPITASSDTTISLPRLKTLKTKIISNWGTRSVFHWEFFARIEMPHLTDLTLALPNWDPTVVALGFILSPMQQLRTLHIHAPGQMLPLDLVLNGSMLPALEEFSLDCPDIFRNNFKEEGWPGLPPMLRRMTFIHCHTFMLHVPFILDVLAESEESWAQFEHVEFRYCSWIRPAEAFQEAIEEWVGRPVSGKIRVVGSSDPMSWFLDSDSSDDSSSDSDSDSSIDDLLSESDAESDSDTDSSSDADSDGDSDFSTDIF